MLLGGGWGELTPASDERQSDGERGKRRDGRDVISEWVTAKRAGGQRTAYVTDKRGFDDVNVTRTDSLLGTRSCQNIFLRRETRPRIGDKVVQLFMTRLFAAVRTQSILLQLCYRQRSPYDRRVGSIPAAATAFSTDNSR